MSLRRPLQHTLIRALDSVSTVRGKGEVMKVAAPGADKSRHVTMVRLQWRRLLFGKWDLSALKRWMKPDLGDPPSYPIPNNQCLGTFVTKDRFVTVAHCLPSQEEVVTVDYMTSTEEAASVDVKCFQNPSYTEGGCDEAKAGDWGIGKVMGSVSDTGVIPIAAALTGPECLYLLKSNGATVCLGEVSKADSSLVCFPMSGKGHGEDGDSGSAVFYYDEGEPRLVAVFSAIQLQSGNYTNWLSSVLNQEFKALMRSVNQHP